MSAPMNTPIAATNPRPAVPMPAAVPTMSAIDPVKLLNKYKWALLAAAVVGAVIGVAAHFVLLRVYPVWRPLALFRCFPPRVSASPSEGLSTQNIEELHQFMATEARIMTGDQVLDRLSKNPQLPSQATKWSASFMETGADGVQRFANLKALEELKDIARARVLPQSSLIELSVSWKEKEDATSILRLLSDTYMRMLEETTQKMNSETLDALKGTMAKLETEISGMVSQRAALIASVAAGGSGSSRQQSELENLRLLQEDRIEKSNAETALTEEIAGMRERANSAEGDKYTDDMRAEADRDMQVGEARSGLQSLERSRKSLIDLGYDVDHRTVKNLDSQIIGARATLDDAIRDALERTFKARLDRLSADLRATTQQVAQADQKIEVVNKAISAARAIDNQIEDLTQRISLAESRRAETASQLQNIQTLNTMASSMRVVVQQPAQPPNLPAFPKIELMLVAGVVLSVMLTGGTFFVRELVDQRIKSPADIGIIPRTRLLGWIPDAAEDPESGGATETAFRDRGKGVVAESFRQLRASVLKRAAQAGYKTIVVMSGLPGSGATTVACNMALAAAASERRVLLIDANLRRPSVHKVFGGADAPGLADVLANKATLDDAIQRTAVDSLDVLSAGSRDLRVVERLSTEGMTELLRNARSAYDLVLIDVAPAVVAGDGVALAGKCDASILVVKAFGEKRGMVARVKNELTDTRGEFLGVIVNAVRAATGGYLKGNIRTAAEYQKS